MAEPFLAEIRITSFGFPPKGWALCNGQLIPINQNQAIFALLGTTFGGNGQTNFALPNLRGRTPIHVGNGHTLGESGGTESHTLSISELPTHTHMVMVSANNSTQASPLPEASVVYGVAPQALYGPATNLATMRTGTVTNTGGSQPHQNMQPYLTLNFCIALRGIFPSRN